MKEYTIDDREIHMVGEYVGVAWNLRYEKRKIKGEDGLTYTADVPLRDSGPYIDFFSIRGEEDDWWVDEDSPVEGGIYANMARSVAAELLVAAEYLETWQKGEK